MKLFELQPTCLLQRIKDSTSGRQADPNQCPPPFSLTFVNSKLIVIKVSLASLRRLTAGTASILFLLNSSRPSLSLLVVSAVSWVDNASCR